MGAFRAVTPTIHTDRKYIQLSDPAQKMFMYLLTCPMATSLPGVIPVGLYGLSEKTGMDVELTCASLREIAGQGMLRCDMKAPLIVLPNAINHSRISSKVVMSWKPRWDEIRDCRLKYALWQMLDHWTLAIDSRLDATAKQNKKKREGSHNKEFREHCIRPHIENAVEFDEFFSDKETDPAIGKIAETLPERRAETMLILLRGYGMAYPIPYRMAYMEMDTEMEMDTDTTSRIIQLREKQTVSGGEE